jgi:hypothetical protein
MVKQYADDQPALVDLAPEASETGSLEESVRKQVARLRELGYIEGHHDGLVELAIVTARDIDRSFGRGAPSGRANLLRVMNEILDALPQPETASRDTLDEAIAAMRADSDDDMNEVIVVDGDVRAEA